MRAVLLIDFGSTNTKVTAVDVDAARLLGTACAYTTISTDINDGLQTAMDALQNETGRIDFAERYACSSAAGGLRMVTSGLVPQLTAEAAKLASLGAGAKVIGVYSYQLTEDDISDIDAAKPDILLLTGGTDGGNTSNIINNASMIAGCKTDFPVVLSGNRVCARECERILAGREVIITKNVMPRFNEVCIEPAKDAIRGLFLRRIVQAKGLSRAEGLVDGILMPTPAAMLKAMELLANGIGNQCGIGELFAVDLGGATTDVYSVADGMPEHVNTVLKGLPEPRVKRTVEGDIGMRYSVQGIIDAAGMGEISRLSGLSQQRCGELTQQLSGHTDLIPDNDEYSAMDFALASLAVRTACIRHAGSLTQAYTPTGPVFVQEGKDLTGVRHIVITGGAAIHAARAQDIAKEALFSDDMAGSLRPKHADIHIDAGYILAAMGLLGERYPEAALQIMKEELEQNGN
ncbi:MAG: methylaspartate mutase accessory protein GlmL [Clostridia bacterium]